MSLALVLDDTSSLISYGGGTWKTSSSGRWFGASTQYPAFMGGSGDEPLTGQVGTMSLSFQGTSISFWGNTNANKEDLNVLTVSIDGGQPYNTTFMNPSRQTWQQWYQSPMLEEGAHQIKFGHIGQAMDVAIINTGQQSALPGQAAIVDSESSSIAYSGSWKQSTDAINSDSTTFPIMFPIGNSTAQSATVGDSLTFKFTGTSATVWGVSSQRFAGTLKVDYTIDGRTTVSKDYSVASARNVQDVPNTAMFTQGGLAAGDHTLTLKVTACAGQTFIFDYITYTPSFLTAISPSSLQSPTSSDTPSLVPGSITASSANSTSTFPVKPLSDASTTTASGLPPVASGSQSNSSSITTSSSDSNNATNGDPTKATGSANSHSTTSKGPSLGLIIGVVCGVIALLVVTLYFWRRRCRKSASKSQMAVPFVAPVSGVASADPLSSWLQSTSQSAQAPEGSSYSTLNLTTAHQEKMFLSSSSRRIEYASTEACFSEAPSYWASHSDNLTNTSATQPETIVAAPPPAYET